MELILNLDLNHLKSVVPHVINFDPYPDEFPISMAIDRGFPSHVPIFDDTGSWASTLSGKWSSLPSMGFILWINQGWKGVWHHYNTSRNGMKWVDNSSSDLQVMGIISVDWKGHSGFLWPCFCFWTVGCGSKVGRPWTHNNRIVWYWNVVNHPNLQAWIVSICFEPIHCWFRQYPHVRSPFLSWLKSPFFICKTWFKWIELPWPLMLSLFLSW